jgi:hypothetical protein
MSTSYYLFMYSTCTLLLILTIWGSVKDIKENMRELRKEMKND